MIRLLCKVKLLASPNIRTNSPNSSYSSMPKRGLKHISSVMSLQDHFVGIPYSVSAPASVTERINSSERPKMVRQFLLDCNFSEPQIESIISRWPKIQLADPKKTLKPKVDFFLSWGMSEADIIKIVLMEPKSLARSLEGHMIPLFDLLRSVVGCQHNVSRVIKNGFYIFRSGKLKVMESNLATLRDSGVPDSRITQLLLGHAKAIAVDPSRFRMAISMAKEMDFDPKGPRFKSAVAVIGWCSKAGWEGKLGTFRSYGLSDDEILMGFKIEPLIMMLKEPNIRAKMDLFVKTLNWSPSKLMISPFILMYSLEGRIVRRLSVLQVLSSRGLVKQIPSVVPFLKMAENKFVEKYVVPFQDKVPRVLEANLGKWKVQDWSAADINTLFKRKQFVADIGM